MKLEITTRLCKGCGICEAFCPKNVLAVDDMGKVHAVKEEECIGCELCQLRCPDFAIKVIKE